MTTEPVVKYSPTYASDEFVNFCFPIPEVMESDRVKLIPFDSSLHAETFFSGTQDTDTYTYLPTNGYASAFEFIKEFCEKVMQRSRGEVLFAVYDKTRVSESGEAAFAGVIGYVHSSATDLFVEIGCVVMLPAFRRTHVTSNAVGILLHYALDLPSDSHENGTAIGGLGVRRCVWMANARNTPSIKTAERMEFVKEGVLRWNMVLTPGQKDAWNGREVRNGDPREECGGRDSVILSHCFDDWENGGREKVDANMARSV